MHVMEAMQSKVVTARAHMSVLEAALRMVDLQVSAMPVMDEAGQVIGIVTESDFLRCAEIDTEHPAHPHPRLLERIGSTAQRADAYVKSHSRKVTDVMTHTVLSVAETADLAHALDLMDGARVGRLLVMQEDGALRGILSRADALAAMVRKIHAVKCAKEHATDMEIRQTIEDEIADNSWLNPNLLSIDVREGEVTLAGSVQSAHDRKALNVLAGNIPGVKKVRDLLTPLEMPISVMPML